MAQWQNQLRKSPHPRLLRSKSTSEVEIPQKCKKSPVRKLSVVGEDDNDVFTSQVGGCGGGAAGCKRFKNDKTKTSGKTGITGRKFSIPEQSVNLKVEATRATKREPRKSPRPHYLDKLDIVKPDTLNIFKNDEGPILSPVPLPAGVECIDPEDDGMFTYWPEFICYLKTQEKKWIVPSKKILDGDTNIKTNRNLLMNWVMELVLHFKVSQETLYHTVRLVDATLAKRAVAPEQLQLVAISAFFISSKLEEYYPPTVSELLAITEDSYSSAELYKMEMRILKLFDGLVYGPDPLVFLNRFIRAAFRENDEKFLETCNMFVDILIPSISYSGETSSLKAATAVFSAKLVLPGHNNDPCWTPTLAYYSGYRETDLIPLAKTLLVKFCKVLKAAKCKTNMDGFVKKFSSRSRHKAVIKSFLEERININQIVANYFSIE